MKLKDLQEDLDKCYIDPDAIEVAWGLLAKDKSTEVKRLNYKKNKAITKIVEKVKPNENFWKNKNELEVARREIGFDSIELKVRNCLSCGTKFESEGTHNRVCDDCRKENGF